MVVFPPINPLDNSDLQDEVDMPCYGMIVFRIPSAICFYVQTAPGRSGRSQCDSIRIPAYQTRGGCLDALNGCREGDFILSASQNTDRALEADMPWLEFAALV